MNNSDVKIKMVSSDRDYDNMKIVRTKVFVEELGIPLEKEFDGNDHHASHVLAYMEKDGCEIPVGTMRIRYFAEFAKFERMTVLKPFRKMNLADQIMNKGFDFISRKGFTKVYGMCKKQILSRWKECGYQEVEGAKHVFQNGMELIPIIRHVPKNAKVVEMTSYPDLLTAEEDHWDQVVIPDMHRHVKIPALILKMRKAARSRNL